MRTTTLGSIAEKKNINKDDNTMTPFPSFANGGIVETGGLAEGGIVNYDPKLKDDLTPGTSDQAAPVPRPQQPDFKLTMDDVNAVNNNPMTDPANMLASLTPPAAAAPAAVPRGTSPTPPPAPAMKLPGMPGVNPDELEAYFQSKRQQVGKYGADAQVAQQQKFAERRNSVGQRLAGAGTNFADALMQGVAEAGNPGFNDKLNANQNRAEDQTLGMMKSAHDQSLADMKEQMGIDAMDPKSSLSKASQKAYGDTLIASGVPPAAVKGMSASLISDVAAKRVTLADAMAKMQLENTWKSAEIGVQKQGMEQKAKEQRMKDLEASGKMGPIDRFMHPGVAKAIDAEAGVGGAGPNFNHAAIQPGTVYQAPDGTWRKKT